MANRFIPGHTCPIVFIPFTDGDAGQGAVLQVTGHTGDWSAVLVSVKHTGTEGYEARVSCGQDARFTVNADFDLDLPPFDDPPTIQPGQGGIIRQYLASDFYNQFGVRVQRVHFQIEMNNVVKYSFDAEMDWLTRPPTIGLEGEPSIQP